MCVSIVSRSFLTFQNVNDSLFHLPLFPSLTLQHNVISVDLLAALPTEVLADTASLHVLAAGFGGGEAEEGGVAGGVVGDLVEGDSTEGDVGSADRGV